MLEGRGVQSLVMLEDPLWFAQLSEEDAAAIVLQSVCRGYFDRFIADFPSGEWANPAHGATVCAASDAGGADTTSVARNNRCVGVCCARVFCCARERARPRPEARPCWCAATRLDQRSSILHAEGWALEQGITRPFPSNITRDCPPITRDHTPFPL